MFLIANFKLDPLSVDNSGNTPLHMACWCGDEELARLLVTKYNCPVDVKNKVDWTPLHMACSHGHFDVSKALVKFFVTEDKAVVLPRDKSGRTPLHLLCSQASTENTEALVVIFVADFKADVTSKDTNGDQPIHAAAQEGRTSTVIRLISEYGCSSDSRGFKKRTLLHHALARGHTSTVKTLLNGHFLNSVSLHCTDDDGNTPLHLSSSCGQPESVRFLLYEYHTPVYVRNKAGKTALDLAKDDPTKTVIREYVTSEHISIQQEYGKLRAKSLQKYPDQQSITRVFVLGNPGSGKSTLVESLKQKGWWSCYFGVTEADMPLHTAGIVPSIYQSEETGRILYYDFAGDKEIIPLMQQFLRWFPVPLSEAMST